MIWLKTMLLSFILTPGIAMAQMMEYSWVDFHGQPQTISVDIPYNRLESAMLSGKDRVSQKSILKLSYELARKIASQTSTTTVHVNVAGTQERFFFAVNGDGKDSDTAFAQALRHELVLEINQSPERGYFIFDEDANGLRPDYLALLSDNQDVFSIFARAMISKFGIEQPIELINQTLALLQQIPYDDMLQDPFPMATPIQLLVERRGDCEAKQVFLIGILQQLFPDRPMGLVNLPTFNHVLAAINLDSALESRVLHDGKPFVLMDATGPASLPFGKVFLYHRDAVTTSWIGI